MIASVISIHETWLSSAVSSSEVFDNDMHRKDRLDNPHVGVLIAAKKELDLQDITCSKDMGLISGTIKVSKEKMTVSSYYRPLSHESYLTKTYDEISKLHIASKKSVFILGGDFNAPDISRERQLHHQL